MNINKLTSMVVLFMALVMNSTKVSAQTNAQVLYDFGSDREFVTLTLEMFKQDNWGSTYFFVDHDFNYDKMVPGSKNVAQGGTYTEISRALNFWKNSSLKNWSLHAEYNGGITKNYPINNAWLFGVKGLKFDGFADFWWETHYVADDNNNARNAHTVFITEPQLWYNVGQHFGCENLSIGGEVELSNNFGSTDGFKCRPCLGVKWDF